MEGDGYWTWREVVDRFGLAVALKLMDCTYYRGDDGWPYWVESDIADALGRILGEDDRGRP
jgi:hypothetical protein